MNMEKLKKKHKIIQYVLETLTLLSKDPIKPVSYLQVKVGIFLSHCCEMPM